MKILLISCGKNKTELPKQAMLLYTGALFKLQLQHAKEQNPDRLYIMSAKYGLLELDELIAPYDYSLIGKDKEFKIEWSNNILHQLSEKNVDVKTDEFIILGGINYWEYLIDHITNYTIPFKGLEAGNTLHELIKAIAPKSKRLF